MNNNEFDLHLHEMVFIKNFYFVSNHRDKKYPLSENTGYVHFCYNFRLPTIGIWHLYLSL